MIILERVGRPFSGLVTEGVGVEAPSWSSSSPSASFSLARSSVERVEVVFTDGRGADSRGVQSFEQRPSHCHKRAATLPAIHPSQPDTRLDTSDDDDGDIPFEGYFRPVNNSSDLNYYYQDYRHATTYAPHGQRSSLSGFKLTHCDYHHHHLVQF